MQLLAPLAARRPGRLATTSHRHQRKGPGGESPARPCVLG